MCFDIVNLAIQHLFQYYSCSLASFEQNFSNLEFISSKPLEYTCTGRLMEEPVLQVKILKQSRITVESYLPAKPPAKSDM
jgi:hypothetical protein